jgi:general secretion pathway protein G
MKIQSSKNPAAFTLIEIMVVVVVIGILAAIIIPQFMGTSEDAKVAAAKATVAELDSAVERFYIQMDRYPTTDEGFSVLLNPPSGDDAKNWRGPYIKKLYDDPWGHPYQYACPGTHHADSYDIWSRGKEDVDGANNIGNW